MASISIWHWMVAAGTLSWGAVFLPLPVSIGLFGVMLGRIGG